MLRKFLLNGALVLTSTLFCLVVGEIICRLFFPDARLRYEADQDVLAAIAPSQNGFIYLSDGSRAPEARINELGLRGASLAEASERRVLFLGDSFTFGSGVREEESFVSLIDGALGEEVTAVNGGHPGYGIYQMEIKFQRLSPVLRPELVVLIIWESFLLRQRHTKEGHQAFIARMEKLNRLKSLSVLGTYVYRLYEQIALRFDAKNLVVALQETKEPQFSNEVLHRRAVRLDSERILRMNDMVRAGGGEFAIVFWPREGYVVDNVEIEMSAGLSAQFEEFAEANGIPFFSVQGAFESYPAAALNIPNDGHPTPFAHCLVARELAGIFEELGHPLERPVSCADFLADG
ncbi:MAG: hypothetical protein GY813_05600 [Halieaceae bacterium]|nr:hypothetical protein [Halieaceae bacterium]